MNWRMCLDWRVLSALAAVGAGVFVFAPAFISAALPLLILAACPVSMLVMMLGMRRMAHTNQAPAGAADSYACPMHPDVRSASPDRCPRCAMPLVPASVPEHEQEPLPELKSKLSRLQAEQEALSEQITALERERVARARTRADAKDRQG